MNLGGTLTAWSVGAIPLPENEQGLWPYRDSIGPSGCPPKT